MTVALYYEDAYLTEFEAGVVAGQGAPVCLAHTALPNLRGVGAPRKE